MASRKEQKQAMRAERERREREAAVAARRRRLRGYAIAVVLAATSLTVVVVAFTAGGGGGGSTKGLASYYPKASIPSAPRKLDLAGAASAAGCRLQTHPAEGHEHTTGPVAYKTNPPSSGNHNPVPASDGAYTQAPGIGNLVHALEHGRVIIWFKPSAPAAVRGRLKAVFDESSDLLVLTPNETGMPWEVAASAWSGDRSANPPPPEFGHVLGCAHMNTKVVDALRAFIAQYRGHGPERINQPE